MTETLPSFRHLERMAFLTSRLRNPADRESQEKPRIDGIQSREEDGHYGADATTRRINSTKNGSREKRGGIKNWRLFSFPSFIYLFIYFSRTFSISSLLFLPSHRYHVQADNERSYWKRSCSTWTYPIDHASKEAPLISSRRNTYLSLYIYISIISLFPLPSFLSFFF